MGLSCTETTVAGTYPTTQQEGTSSKSTYQKTLGVILTCIFQLGVSRHSLACGCLILISAPVLSCVTHKPHLGSQGCSHLEVVNHICNGPFST